MAREFYTKPEIEAIINTTKASTTGFGGDGSYQPSDNGVAIGGHAYRINDAKKIVEELSEAIKIVERVMHDPN